MTSKQIHHDHFFSVNLGPRTFSEMEAAKENVQQTSHFIPFILNDQIDSST